MLNTARELLDAAQRSGFITVRDVEQLGAELETARIVAADEAAARLVDQQTLTLNQVEALLAGRGEESALAGRYLLQEKLGEGAMGTVFKAVDHKLDRTVAVKVLPPHSLADPDAVARFDREAKALARLSHPHIIQAFD